MSGNGTGGGASSSHAATPATRPCTSPAWHRPDLHLRSLTRASAIARDPRLRPPDSLARIANEPKDPRRSAPIDRDSNAATPPPREKRRRVEGGRMVRGRSRPEHATSNRSSIMTLSHALTKSCTNFALASSDAYTSTGERRCELEPKTRSTAMVVQRVSPVARSRPSEKGGPLRDAPPMGSMATPIRSKGP
jgi:hypothetical protein